MKKITIIIGSVTYAAKAKRILSGYRIPVRLIKTTADGLGCMHGIEINYVDYMDVIGILMANGISYSVSEQI